MMDAMKSHKHYTYADYCEWPEDVRCEIIDGIAYMMASPSTAHQEVVGEVFVQLATFLKGKPCKVYVAPLSVRLNYETGDDTVVEPDILVVCDSSKLDKKGCNGAPDLVVEVLSPSTALYDTGLKFSKYLEAGVREYWVVDPENKVVTTYIIDGTRADIHVYKEGDTAPVHVLDGCTINLAEVFAEV